MTEKTKYWIVWNENRTEGFVTDFKVDAQMVFHGKFRGSYTSAGSAFREAYENEDLHIEEVEL